MSPFYVSCLMMFVFGQFFFPSGSFFCCCVWSLTCICIYVCVCVFLSQGFFFFYLSVLNSLSGFPFLSLFHKFSFYLFLLGSRFVLFFPSVTSFRSLSLSGSLSFPRYFILLFGKLTHKKHWLLSPLKVRCDNLAWFNPQTDTWHDQIKKKTPLLHELLPHNTVQKAPTVLSKALWKWALAFQFPW